MIPRVLHQIWRPAPAAWMDSWRRLNPDFAYRFWDEGTIDGLGPRYRTAYERYLSEGIFDGAADVARLEVLRGRGAR